MRCIITEKEQTLVNVFHWHNISQWYIFGSPGRTPGEIATNVQSLGQTSVLCQLSQLCYTVSKKPDR